MLHHPSAFHAVPTARPEYIFRPNNTVTQASVLKMLLQRLEGTLAVSERDMLRPGPLTPASLSVSPL
jgi:hypothetical protein